jgi:hypothetical protein
VGDTKHRVYGVGEFMIHDVENREHTVDLRRREILTKRQRAATGRAWITDQNSCVIIDQEYK